MLSAQGQPGHNKPKDRKCVETFPKKPAWAAELLSQVISQHSKRTPLEGRAGGKGRGEDATSYDDLLKLLLHSAGGRVDRRIENQQLDILVASAPRDTPSIFSTL